jgi:gluconolactonase
VYSSSIERLDAAINVIIDKEAQVEVIGKGFEWAEGPLWLEREQTLLFSDVPKNTVYKWTEANGIEPYLTPSGYTDSLNREGEIGSNGLTLNAKRQLVLCQHGNRQVAVMTTPINGPKPIFTAIARLYQGKRFNSPNDLAYDAKGNLYFTDPPYGLEYNMEDTSKELPFQGVYRVDTAGNVFLLTDSITRPNGIALTRDETRLMVANSDSMNAKWYIYDLKQDGTLRNGRVFYDATAARKKEKGNPDGLKIDMKGNVFASGPGGLWIFNKEGTVLGKIKVSKQISNCTFSSDEKVLYLTADDCLLRLTMRK